MEIIVSEDYSGSKTVELWIRSFAPAATGPTQERALDAVDSLESADAVDSITIGVWGKEIERTPRSRRIPQLHTIRTRLDAFEQWADRTGRQLTPFFRTRTVDSAITDDRYEVRRLPTVALAEFVDDELVHVAPCRDGDRTIDVFDRLDALTDDETERSVVTFDERHESDDEVSDRTRSRVTPVRRSRFVGPLRTGSN